MHTTNYTGTFISVAPDCPALTAEEPRSRPEPTIAELHHRLILEAPYRYTSDDVVFETFARRTGVPAELRAEAREAFFSRGQPCLRSSPLGKRYGWGIHHDSESRVAIYPVESPEYAAMAADPALSHVAAMRSRRG